MADDRCLREFTRRSCLRGIRLAISDCHCRASLPSVSRLVQGKNSLSNRAGGHATLTTFVLMGLALEIVPMNELFTLEGLRPCDTLLHLEKQPSRVDTYYTVPQPLGVGLFRDQGADRAPMRR